MKLKNKFSGLFIILLITSAAVLLLNCGKEIEADNIFINGTIITMDPANPEAGAFATAGERIVAIGSSDEIKKRFPSAAVTDLLGKVVMPGIVESHGHVYDLGKSFMELNLTNIKDPEEAVLAVEKMVQRTPKGEWIMGWGWDEGAWAKNYPNNLRLSQVSPDNPVCLKGLHGFACWANQKALQVAGITTVTPNPANGRILKDAKTGQPSGILTNKAQDLLFNRLPKKNLDHYEKAYTLAFKECLAQGLTSLHDARVTAPMLAALKSLQQKNKLMCRTYVMLDGADEQLVETYLKKGPEIDPSHRLTIRCIKIFVDGALGSRGAAFFQPYSDSPKQHGVVVTDEEKLFQVTSKALQAGFQVASHAIGDRANRITLNAFKRALKEVPSASNHRVRLEHAQVMDPADIGQFAPLKIVVSMQPPHATSDMPWAETRVGPERIKSAYAWRSFLNSGVHLTLNSDFPGETLNPFYGMYAAETRQNPAGLPVTGWYPNQCLKREEILKAYTVEAAYAGFEETSRGQIKVGMLADFIVISANIRSVPVKQLLKIKVEKTYLGGRLVFHSK